MTHPNSNKSGGARAGRPARQRSRAKGVALSLAIAAVALTALWLGSGNRQPQPAADGAATAPPPAFKASQANPPASATEATPELQKLKGQWLRPDGGYVIEVRNIDAKGQMEAAYFNPQPIHVARAEASQEGSTIRVFIELRDVNYPGCTYHLTYDAREDRLAGVYYQAAIKESYEVEFVRKP